LYQYCLLEVPYLQAITKERPNFVLTDCKK
jgi:hypothetical protein